MSPPRSRTLAYARAWLRGPEGFEEQDVVLDRDGVPIPATVVRPSGATERLPGWVVLHGITLRGRSHEALMRFTRSVAATGAVVIVPEVPEWMALELAPHLARPTIQAAIAGLLAYGRARDSRAGVIAFSFGAPHAVAATAHPALRDQVAGSVAFGSYCSLERTTRFMLTGAHEWQGRAYHALPDTYGRWILGVNHLTSVPEFHDAGDVAQALRSLAVKSSELWVPARDPRLDDTKREARLGVAEERRALFDVFAPTSDRLPDPVAVAHVAEALAAPARRVDEAGELAASLAEVDLPAHVLHGRHDALIPFTEGLRLRASLARTDGPRALVTEIFGHSGEHTMTSVLRSVVELPAFVLALRRVLRTV